MINHNTSNLYAKKGYNGEEYKSNMWPAMLLHSNIKAHVYKSVKHQTKGVHILFRENVKIKQGKYRKWNPPYKNVSAKDDINSKKAEANRWELCDKLEYV